MSLLAGLFSKSFGRLWGKRRGALAAAAAIALYTLLVGAGPAVVRAALMAGIGLFARQVGRRQDGLNTLAFVAAVMALFDPLILGDIGFQLSFMATLGLILYAEPLSRGFEQLAARRFSPETAHRLSGPVGEYFLFTLAAQATTLPLILFHFNTLSLSAVLANPLILPAQPAVMTLSGLAAILGLLWQPLGQLAAWLAWPFAAYTIRVVEWFGGLPGGALALGEFGLLLVILSYALLFGLTFAGARVQGLTSKLTPAAGLTALGVVTVLVWRTALAGPDGRLHLTVLDVSVNGKSGSAVLVQTPGGRSLLIDGGPATSLLSDALGRRLPPGRRRLDWLVVAGSGAEQLQGLPRNLERFPPDRVLWSGAPAGSTAAGELRQAINELGIPLESAAAGQALDLGDGAVLRVLSAGRRGAVLLLEWGSFQALLPQGVDAAALDALPADLTLPEVDILLLADSGYAPSTPPEWLARFNPRLALLSVAADDYDERPDEALLDALEGRNLLRTDLNGWIEISTDGQEMWVEAARSNQPSSSPTLTSPSTQTSTPRWQEYERALSQAVVNTEDALCEWEILGTSGDEVFVWALCKVTDSVGTAGSGPAVIQLGEGGKIEKVTLPRDGNFYPSDIQVLFPQEIQNKISRSTFNWENAEKHINERLVSKGPPLIAIEGDHFP